MDSKGLKFSRLDMRGLKFYLPDLRGLKICERDMRGTKMSLGVRKINLRKLSQSSKGSKKFWPKPKNDSDPVSGLENDQPLKVNNEREIYILRYQL